MSRDIFSKHIGDLLRPIREPRDVNDTAGQLAEKNQNRLVVEAQENLGALNADSTRRQGLDFVDRFFERRLRNPAG